MKWLAGMLAAAVLGGAAAGATGPATGSAVFLAGRQSASGGFAEQGRAPDGPLTAWAALGLVAAGGFPTERARALEFLRSSTADISTDADLALRVVALAALGETIDEGAARAAPPASARRPRQRDDLGRARVARGRGAGAAGVHPGDPGRAGEGRWLPVVAGRDPRLERHGRGDSGTPRCRCRWGSRPPGRGRSARVSESRRRLLRSRRGASRTRSRPPGRSRRSSAPARSPASRRFGSCARLRRADGSYRYSVRYGTTPVWVTAQVLPALAGKPFPLR